MRKLALCLAAGLSLSACENLVDSRSAIFDQGAQVNDELLVTSEMWICLGASIGSIQRRYMRSDEDWQTWNDLCRSADAVAPPTPVQ